MSLQSDPLTRDIRIGAVFPQNEIGTNPADIARHATTVEAMGLKHLLAFDHVIGGSLAAYPELQGRYNSNTMFHEVFVLFGYLAALTTDLELASGVIILPQRQTALAAKQAAEIDLLSGGRLRLGVGIGWNKIEYEALNENFRNRASRIEDQVSLMRELWCEPLVNHTTPYHSVRDAGILPLPVQRPIPIWFGGSAEPAVRRAARIGDGFMSTTALGPNLDAILGWINDELDRVGKPRSGFGLEGRISMALGDEDRWKREFAFWREAGATHISLETNGGVFHGVDAHLAALERGLRAVEDL
ncbi:MAG: LLM class F420-dependent oxidoreductase [Thermomicrobiales bacterium]|nr:LLM class F420-dependent oxidoreductase [Thermomicrobiales bacterium]